MEALAPADCHNCMVDEFDYRGLLQLEGVGLTQLWQQQADICEEPATAGHGGQLQSLGGAARENRCEGRGRSAAAAGISSAGWTFPFRIFLIHAYF